MVRYWMSLWLGVVGAIGLLGNEALAQSVIVPDGTLGSERSQVEFRAASERITGGAARGINLFHSFREFNVGEGRTTYFMAPNSGIENILARVTGSNRSDILGKLGTAQLVNGFLDVSNANLFLINPNGIVFGKNSSLDVDRSFVATTANAIGFGDRGDFSATNPTNSTPLLTVNPSTYLFNQVPVGNIVNRSVAGNAGLRVPNGQSLTLLGGDVTLEGGRLSALGGRVEIGAVAGPGTVGLGVDGSLGFAGGVERGTVQFEQGAVVRVDGVGGGDIGVAARNIEVRGRSVLQGGIFPGLGTPNSRAGTVRLAATGTVTVAGSGSRVANDVRRGATGTGGDLVIDAPEVMVRDGAQLSAVTLGTGNAGSVLITARDRVLFQNRGAAFSSVEVGGVGQGGNVVINAPVLEVRDGAQLIANTRGIGNAGNVLIMARDHVLFQNGDAFSSVEVGAKGRGGNVEISSGSLEVRDGAQLTSSTQGKGDAGDIKIRVDNSVTFHNGSAFSRVSFLDLDRSEISTVTGFSGGNILIDAKNLQALNGSILSTETQVSGNAGSIIINATDSLMLSGWNPYDDVGTPSQIRSLSLLNGKGGDILIQTPKLTVERGAEINAGTLFGRSGGNILLNLGTLNVLDGGQVYTRSSGDGSAGSIIVHATDRVRIEGTDPDFSKRVSLFPPIEFISSPQSTLSVRSTRNGITGSIVLTTPTLTLDQQGRIDAQSSTVSGGNIFLTVPSLLLLRNGSQISATAGTANPQALGNGGNIDINARFIVAIPKENSDITANATQGRGGNVNINSQGIFGLKLQPKLTPLSDITASSEVGLTGNITLNTPDNSAIQNSLNQLPKDAIDTTKLLSQTCLVRKDKPEGTFYIVGAGGLPNRPGDLSPAQYPTNTIQPTQTVNRPWQKGDPIVEPTGFYQLANGRLVMSRECDRASDNHSSPLNQ